VVAIPINGWGRNVQSLLRMFHRCFLPSFGSFGLAVSEKKLFLNRPIRKKNCLWCPCLIKDRDEMCNPYRGPSILDVLYQDLIHLRTFFQNRPIKIKNCLVRSFLLTDRDRMSHLHRGPYLDASYQDAVHLVNRLQRRRLF
jgi:hypothetical protein